jgi:DNA-binding MarR family transcriptional regulator
VTSNAKRAAGGAEPRWLTPDEQAAWLSLAGILIRLPAALDAQLQRDAGMNTFEYFVLTGLSQAPGHTLRMTDLAAVASGSASRLSHVVKRLEQRGWVRRELDAQDARCTNAVLTDAGWDTVVASAAGHVETVRHLVIDALTGGQVRQLHEIGERILGRLAPGEPCTAYRPATPHTEPTTSHAEPATSHAEPATPETEPATHRTMSATRRAKPATRRAKPATARSTKEPAP